MKKCRCCKNDKDDMCFEKTGENTTRRICNICICERNKKKRDEKRGFALTAVSSGLKRCSKCLSIKELNEFSSSNRGKYKIESRCKNCVSLQNRIKIYNLSHREVVNFINTEKCDICKNIFESTKKKHVDHDHKSNKVRGTLCDNCNIALGNFKDSVDILKNAIKYLNDNN